MSHLFSKTENAFGLDVSGTSFKIMEFHSRHQATQVKGFIDTPLPKGMILNDAISDVKTFTYLIKQSLDRPQFGHISTNRAIVSLPESKSFIRVIQIPQMSDAEAESAVPFEAESFIPLPIDQVYLDWQKLGEAGDKLNILIIASPKDFVDKYLDILDKAGLKTVALEVESQSCHRALIDPDSKETLLIVDLDAYRSSLIMVEEGALQFTSTIPVAGNTFTESIARALGVSSVKAEEIKRKVGISNTAEYPNVKTALLPVLNNLSAEIKNILKFHHDHSEKPVSKILLVGGSAKIKNLSEFLQPQLAELGGEMKVELANVWQNANLASEPPLDALQSLGFVTAIGLAMRGSKQ